MRMAEDGGETGGATDKRFPAGWGLVARRCDYCNSAAAFLFCRTDSAFLCMACDCKTHATNTLGSRHERVWMCEVCEQAPASVTCKADAAALCFTCDRDIHSANPLARRHERAPVVPFYDTAESVVKSTAATFLVSINNSDNNLLTSSGDHDTKLSSGGHDTKLNTCVAHDDSYITDPWVSSNPTASRVPADGPEIKSMEFLFSETDNYLDFEFPISSEARFHPEHDSSGTDGVVPVQTAKSSIPAKLPGHSSQKHFEIDFTKSHIGSYNNCYPPQSLSHSVSSSSLDVSVVPDGSSMSDISFPFGRSMSCVDLSGSSSANQVSQLVGMDREARVLRYREKRKSRKFEKTIRYASRKAYAETRPRIKGRFAKRNEVNESDIDQMFSPASTAAFFPETRFGIVPSL